MRSRRSGFTLVEVVIVMLIMALLARIALPKIEGMIYKARAVEALSSIHAIRTAAYAYNTDTNLWPPDVSPGVLPPEMEPYLPAGFSFQREDYQLDWDNWTLPDGSPRHPDTGVMLGVSVTTSDPVFGQALEQLVGTATVHWTLNNNYTFVIAAI